MTGTNNVLDIIRSSKKEGIQLFVEDGRLGMKKNKGVKLSDHLSEIIRENKEAIIHFFENDFKGVRSAQTISVYTGDDLCGIPLSYAQERLWFIDELSGSLHYHIPIIFRISGSLDIDILEKSFQSLIDRHQALRTVISEEDGVAYQELKPSSDFRCMDLGKIDESLLTNNTSSFIARPFDLSGDYMLRVGVYDLGLDQYALVLVLHHIASDGWSIPILFNELQYFYNNLLAGASFDLPDLPIQYSDYSIWQRSDSQVDLLSSQLSFWKDRLSGVPVLELPTDYVRPSIQSTRGSSYSFSIDSNLSRCIRDLVQSEDCSLFMFLLSSYTILLHRYTGQEDICVGTPVANRGYQEIEGLIGFFVNTLALRTQLDCDQDFTSFLQAVKLDTLLAYDHQEVPFEKIVSEIGLERDQSRSALFQTMLVLQNNDRISDIRFGSSQVDIEAYDYAVAKEDLTLYAADSGDELGFSFEYCTDLFDESTIIRMAAHFQNLLEAIVSAPKDKISSYEILSDKEKNQILKEFNTTRFPFLKNSTVLDFFINQANINPQGIAIQEGNIKMTYQELDEKSTRIAKYLIGTGITKEELIPICINRSWQLVTGILGILKSGGAYVPIDPAYPKDRIKFIIQNTKAKYILSNHDLVKESEISIISLENILRKSNSFDQLTLPIIKKDQLAYVIYTSGTTGEPKGVMIEHRSLMNLCQWHIKEYEVDEYSHATLFSGVGFDASVWELFPYLASGSCVFPIPELVRLNIRDLADFIQTHKITHTYLPTSLYTDFASEYKTDHMLKVLVGGEALTKIVDNESIELYNNYGPTENTVVATFYPVKNGSTDSISIGKPISNTTLYIMDDLMRICPLKAIGELYIGGDSLARGYFNDEKLTSEKFIINPFSKDQKLYRTGDMVRWLEDGNIEFIGRADDQIKIRGYRIELGEIESHLSRIKGVSDTSVVTQKNNNNPYLVGYYTGKKFDDHTIKTQLKSLLPEYMIPLSFIYLEEFPITPNGKIDKNRLPKPDIKLLKGQSYVAPATPIEIELVSVLEKLLDRKKIGIEDNFFELGGHSLMAVRLASQLSSLYDLDIKVQAIFEYSTIGNLSKYIELLLPQEEKETITKTFEVFSL
ncbi:amino acid adenylation domain-containing protein [Aquimarina sp. BL5]|uniref:non-ribosomal peptide synthetase n=1 Tax=Aquimarina sp. BL5 TaxID=1714860 RepID=UPI000E4BB741|nr:non-ribosomal peptide synthetase [Aquimarina sp. BL5]AXT51938.1 amino acid adenylation domain-containing protein [Aquimarina sp. BL5]RKN03799.1 amino acid adenylation domain-containing protein [Aquimarina sp. BL5]